MTFLVQFKRFRRGVPKLSERFTLQLSMASGLAPQVEPSTPSQALLHRWGLSAEGCRLQLSVAGGTSLADQSSSTAPSQEAGTTSGHPTGWRQAQEPQRRRRTGGGG